MSVEELKEYTLRAKYARYNKEAKRRETYKEANDRVRNMMHGLYPGVEKEIDWAYDLVDRGLILGSQRALQFGGRPALQHNARVYNCTSSYCDRIRFFQEAFYLLLCGCGTGFSVQKHHIAKLPAFSRLNRDVVKRFVVPDTIEGWADALGMLLSVYFSDGPFPKYEGCIVEFDFSLIRPEGSYLSSGAGKAPGPEPLRRSLEKIRQLLDSCLALGRGRLRPIDAYDIVMHASDAVLAGGVRRSATICVFSWDDMEMMTAKTGNWYEENPQRGRSNNSVLLVRGQTTKQQFREVMQHVREWGEPGFYWSDSTEQLPNPCFSPETRLATENGMERIIDLYNRGQENRIVADNRAGKGNNLDLTKKGLSVYNATPVKLTQKQAPVFELITEHGHKLRVTQNHTFPTTRGRLELKDMLPGDTILLPSDEGKFGNIGTFNEGLVLGLLTGDGTISGEDAFVDVWNDDFDQLDSIKEVVNSVASQMESATHRKDFEWIRQTDVKKRIGGRRLYRFLTHTLKIESPVSIKVRVPECVFQGSREFVKGYLQGLLFCDGTVNLSGHKLLPTLSWRLNQSNPELLRDVQILLGQFGVVSRLTPRRKSAFRFMPDGKGGQKSYLCKDNYEIIMSRPNAKLAYDTIGAFGRKSAILERLFEYCGQSYRKPERYMTRVKSIEFHSVTDVYCLTQDTTNTVIANGVVAGQCVEIGFYPCIHVPKEKYSSQKTTLNYQGPMRYDESENPILSGWQFCVAGDTRLITRNGIETISDVVGKEIDIWNGEEWSPTKPFITGYNQKLYRVQFGDGSFLDATENHRFLVADRVKTEYREVCTKDLITHSRYPLHVPRSKIPPPDAGIHQEFAYEYGFILGDGSVRFNHMPDCRLFGPKMKLPLRGTRGEISRLPKHGVDSQHITFDDVDNGLSQRIKFSTTIPNEIFSWDYDSIIGFISGWADADGSEQNAGCRIYGTEQRMRDLQLLLSKVGIVSSVNLMSEKGEATNSGERIQSVWYVQVPNASRLRTFRLSLKRGRDAKKKGKHQVVRSVTELPGLHTTYCLEEKKRHQCVFNNVLTLQCNLSTINGQLSRTPEEFYRNCVGAATIGTLQAAMTHFPYLGPVTEAIVRREALLGVSITGVMDSPKILLDPEVLRNGARIVLETNERIAKKIGIHVCARGTCLKPEGTSSCLLGTASGAGPWKFKRGFRRVQANRNEAVANFFEQVNPWAVEKSKWCANGTTKVITFCLDAPEGAIIEGDMTAVEYLNVVKLLQENWVQPGKRAECCTQPWLTNNVSNTVTVKPHEWDEVIDHIYTHRDSYAGISLLAASGDKDYPQAPFTAVYYQEEIEATYGRHATQAARPLLVTALDLYNNDVFDACSDVLSTKSRGDHIKDRFVESCLGFADIFLDGDIKRLTYLLKDLDNLRRWSYLKEMYQPVDYNQLIEETDETKPQEELACAGGACQI